MQKFVLELSSSTDSGPLWGPFPVLAFLAIFRQIRDFGPLYGDGNYELAIYRQSANFRDFEPQKVAILANSSKTWRFWRNIEEIEGKIQRKEAIFK